MTDAQGMTDITRRWPNPSGGMPPEANPGGAPPASPLQLGKVLKRRRWTFAIVFVTGLVFTAGFVALWLKPAYEAVSQIEVSPVMTRILYQDESSKAMPFFDSFLHTQKELIRSDPVLERALADESTQGLPIQEKEDPLKVLRNSLTVEAPARTQLLGIRVRQPDRESSLALTGAVVDAYMSLTVADGAQKNQQKREVLLTKLRETDEKIASERRRLNQLADAQGSIDPAVLNGMREELAEARMETRKSLQEAELRIRETELHLELIDTRPVKNNRNAEVVSDPVLQSLQDELALISDRLFRTSQIRSENHHSVLSLQKRKEEIEKKIEQRQVEVAQQALSRQKENEKAQREETRRQLEAELAAARGHHQALQQKLDQQRREGQELGENLLSIQDHQQRITELHAERDRYDERLKQLEMESQRPGRVSVVSGPGMDEKSLIDKRKKWAVLGLVGWLILGCGAALVRDRFDPHVRAPDAVESRTGLRLLGAVPCLRELRTGRVNKDDFLESYRVVRANLAGVNDDDRIPSVLLVTSAQTGEGKTSVSVSLAGTLAEAGSRVLLIDGDTQAPQIASLLGIDGYERGRLAAMLRQELPLAETVIPHALPGVDILVPDSQVPYESREALNHHSAAALLEQARKEYDYVVIDTPPALGAADVLEWAHLTDGIVLTSIVGYSDMTAMDLTCKRLKSVSHKIQGVVVSNVPRNDSYFSYSTLSTAPEGMSATGNGRKVRTLAQRGRPVISVPNHETEQHAGPSAGGTSDQDQYCTVVGGSGGTGG